MKALSIHPIFASMIFCGDKTIEVRTWSTDYRGDLLICSTNKKIKDTIPGHGLCVVTLKDVVPMQKKHCKAACMPQSAFQPGLFAWMLEDLRLIKPIPLKGKLSLWNYDGEIEYIQPPETEEEDEKLYHDIWEPLFI